MTMTRISRTLLAATAVLALIVAVAAVPRPGTTTEDVSPVNRAVEGGLTTQAICFCAAYFNEGCTRQETYVCDNPAECKAACCDSATANGDVSADAEDIRIIGVFAFCYVFLLVIVMQAVVQSMFDQLLPPACPTYTGLLPLITTLLQDRSCFRAALSKGLGLGIIAAAGLIKLPQIVSIITSRSSAGLSKTTFLVETFGHTYNLAAHVRQGYPPSTYGDFAALLLQNYILLVLIYAYSGQPTLGVSIVVGAISLLGGMCSAGFPLGVLQTLTAGNVVLVFASRLPQALANYRAGSTGALSAVTCVGMWLGATARIFTTLTEVDDASILAGYVAAAVLNGIVAGQVLYYRGNKRVSGVKPAPGKKVQ